LAALFAWGGKLLAKIMGYTALLGNTDDRKPLPDMCQSVWGSSTVIKGMSTKL